jgi:enoyl-CoA hydratase/carnithine racemase
MTVTIEELGAARVITWDRQARRNAWELATMTAIADAVEAAGADPAVRCVVLRGAGEHFSAGDDLHAATQSDAAAWAATIEGFQRMTRVVLAVPVPAIAAVDGVCVGGALEFAASCDLRLCTDRVRLLTPEVGIGLVASNAGTLLLPEVLGESAARELLLSGEPRDAAWAREHGFATEVVAPDQLASRIEHWTEVFSRSSRDAVAATKAMLNGRFGELLPAAMERETDHCVRLFGEPDARAALSAFAGRTSQSERPHPREPAA